MFDEVGQRFLARGDRRQCLGRFDEEVRERALVARELREEVIGRGKRRREVFGRLAQRRSGSGVLFGRALDELLQALAGLRVEYVEQLVEIDRFARALARNVAPDGSAGRLFGPGVSAT